MHILPLLPLTFHYHSNPIPPLQISIRVLKECLNITGRKAVPGLTWCLSEVQLEKNREIIMKGACATLIQDARQQRLLIRAYVTDHDYNQSLITIGWKKDYGGGAEAICAATMDAFRMFATPQPPTGPNGVKHPALVDVIAKLKDSLPALAHTFGGH